MGLSPEHPNCVGQAMREEEAAQRPLVNWDDPAAREAVLREDRLFWDRDIGRALRDICKIILDYSLFNLRQNASASERKFRAQRRAARAELNALERQARSAWV